MTRRQIGYPGGWTLAVLDDSGEARAAVDEVASSGVPREDVVLLDGPDAHDGLERLGASSGFLGRMRRGLQFMTMDQLPDLVVYEEAMRLGHPLVGIRVADGDRRRQLIEALRRHGAHFINRFGSWATEEIAPWRGTMPDLPQVMRR
jgi:hypothetical protein